MKKFKHTEGEWRYQPTAYRVDYEGYTDENENEYDIVKGDYLIATVMDGVEGYHNAEANAKLIVYSPLMLKELISNYETYQVLKEVFENKNPMVWSMIQGAYLHTAKNTKEVIELVAGLTIEEVLNND